MPEADRSFDHLCDLIDDRLCDLFGDRLCDHNGDRLFDLLGDRLWILIGDRLCDLIGDRLCDLIGDRLCDLIGDRLMLTRAREALRKLSSIGAATDAFKVASPTVANGGLDANALGAGKAGAGVNGGGGSSSYHGGLRLSFAGKAGAGVNGGGGSSSYHGGLLLSFAEEAEAGVNGGGGSSSYHGGLLFSFAEEAEAGVNGGGGSSSYHGGLLLSLRGGSGSQWWQREFKLSRGTPSFLERRELETTALVTTREVNGVDRAWTALAGSNGAGGERTPSLHAFPLLSSSSAPVAAGSGERGDGGARVSHLLVGRSHECKFPPSLLALPCVSSPALGPDLEQQSCATVHDRLMELVTTGRGVTDGEAAQGRASCVALRHALQHQLRQAGAEAFIAPAATGIPPRHDRRSHHSHCHHASRPHTCCWWFIWECCSWQLHT
ncbi:unnamed protein product [Closterium sp. Yama58-4]|nr:unnamed protein product [Closterium sp. Yama58-4]